jgi:DinB family protein
MTGKRSTSWKPLIHPIDKESSPMSPAAFPSLLWRRFLAQAVIWTVLAVVTLPVPARAQDAAAKESSAAVKAAFLADLEGMRGKFVGLAEAFPPDKYSWRPMDGVRSVSEVLMLIASEGYGFAPTAFGGKPAMSREESGALSKVTDKTQVIGHLNKAFAYAKQTIEAIDPSTLMGKRSVFGRERSTPEVVLFLAGDMHEHLGQLIAYARTNRIVPPWSK